jgi:hypothetical protein
MKDIENPFIHDLVFLLREKRDESKKLAKTDDLELGQYMAYSDVLSLIYLQAIAFGIDLEDIGMPNDPETEL